jgi:hypothetical protein
LTQSGGKPSLIPAAQQAPDLVFANPLSLPLHGLGQRMQFGQLKRREFIMRRPTPTAVHFGHSSG